MAIEPEIEPSIKMSFGASRSASEGEGLNSVT